MSSSNRHVLAIVAVALSLQLCFWLAASRQALAQNDQGAAPQGKAVKLLNPLDGATVREKVPIKVSRDALPANGGYVSVFVDGVFLSANVIPDSGTTVFEWDTKGDPILATDPSQVTPVPDGPHAIVVKIFDHDSNLTGTATANVLVANKVKALPDGVQLVYHFPKDQMLTFRRTSKLLDVTDVTNPQGTSLQESSVKFERSVEDVTDSHDFLIRDQILPGGTISISGTPYSLDSLYMIKSKYQTVNKFGELVQNNQAFTAGDHLGFEVSELPNRRVSAGDSWQTHIRISIPWNTSKPTLLTATGLLEGFEWQNDYPTAKIVETYDGPATLYAGPEAAMIPITATNVHVARNIWFAYGSGRIVRETTSFTVTASVTATQYSAISGGATQPQPQPEPGAQQNPANPTFNPVVPNQFGQGTQAEPVLPLKLRETDVTNLVPASE
jgi:hypothetical protein